MIPSSLNCLLLIALLLSPLAYSMDRPAALPKSSSGTVHTRPQGAIPSSSSMAFPPTKKDNIPDTGSLRKGSIIKRVARTASEFWSRRSSSGEVVPEKTNPSAAAQPGQPAISAPLTSAALKAVTPSVTEKKELVIGQPIYIITHNKNEGCVKIEGRCDAVYRVSCIKDFKDNGYLQRQEVLVFIDDLLKKMGKKTIATGDSMLPKDRERVARHAIHYIKANHNKPEFNTPFYLVTNQRNTRFCVFESELEEFKK